jgi:hypothetical protein
MYDLLGLRWRQAEIVASQPVNSLRIRKQSLLEAKPSVPYSQIGLLRLQAFNLISIADTPKVRHSQNEDEDKSEPHHSHQNKTLPVLLRVWFPVKMGVINRFFEEFSRR